MGISCVQCGYDNPAKARYCLDCGSRLEAECQACGHIWPPHARFCGHCGSSLNNQGNNQTSAIASLASERRHVTILFADIAGFTLMAEQFDPEIVTGALNDCFRVLGEVCHRYGGVIDKFIGDSMMVLFGAPKAHEDDPARALHAAIAMRRRLETFNSELPLRLGTEEHSTKASIERLAIHIGINTGEVIAGSVGTGQRQDYTAIGDAVNLAARLQESAGPGEIYVSQQTQHLTRDKFAYHTLPPLQVKGKREPIGVFQLLGEQAPVSHWQDLSGLDSPLVGRRREFRLLRRRLQRLVAGEGQIVAVVGEAGIGKSRLVTEVHCAVSSEPLQWAEGRCLAYGQPVSHGVSAEILRALLQAAPSAPASLVRRRLRARLTALLPQQSTQDYAYLGHLLNLHLTEEKAGPVRNLDPQALRLQVLQALIRLIRASALQIPLVLVFEDIHWADAASVELLNHLIPLTASVPLMILWITRPERASEAWTLLEAARVQAEDRFSEIWLHALSAEESELLAQNLLGSDLDHRSARTRELILGRANGNPFFMEEILRSLLSSEALQPVDGAWRIRPGIESEMPETLRGVLMARIDHLESTDRQVLQRSAVLGRIFPARLLELVVDPGIDLGESLMRLQQEGMIRPRESANQTYIFKHTLMQEAAYDSLLLSHRRTIHRRAGEGLEQLCADRLEDQYALLVHHFQEGQVWDKAFDYAEKAARQAQQTYANEEARTFFHTALAILPHLGDGPRRHRKRFELLVALEKVLDRLGHREEQQTALAELSAIAEQLDDPQMLTECRIRQGRYLWRTGRYDAAVTVLETGVEASRSVGDLPRLSRALANLGTVHWFQSTFSEALGHFQEALQLAQDVGDARQECRILNNMGVVYSDLQQNEEALRCYQRGLSIAEETGNLLLQGVLSNNIAHIQHDRGEFSQSRKGYEMALTISRLVGNRRGETVAAANLADLDRHLGNYEAALDGFRLSLEMDRNMGNQIGQAATQANISCVLRIQGRFGLALDMAQVALASHRRLAATNHVASSCRRLAQLYSAVGSYAEAENLWQECRALSESLGLKVLLAEAYWGLSVVAQAQGRWEQSRHLLDQAERSGQLLESSWHTMRVHIARATHHLAQSELDFAEYHVQQALTLSDVGPSPHGRLAAQNCMAQIALVRNDPEAAFRITRSLWERLQGLGHFDGSEAGLALTCWGASKAAAQHGWARLHLHWGYERLMEQAASLKDRPSLGRSLLRNVPVHLALLSAWAEHGEEDNDPSSGSNAPDD